MSRQTQTIQQSGETAGVHLWLVLWKAFEAVRAYSLRNIASLGLGLSDFALLELLLHKGPSAVNEIGSRIGLTSGSMTVAVDRLEKKGLVERRNQPGDRRTRVVHLTDKGRRLIECAFARHAEAFDELSSALSGPERAEAVRLLKKLGKAAEAAVRASTT